jgi:hypothetical protein
MMPDVRAALVALLAEALLADLQGDTAPPDNTAEARPGRPDPAPPDTPRADEARADDGGDRVPLA